MKLGTPNICVGAGLVSLDILIRDGSRFPLAYYVGGTCGNVMMILAHMGWEAYPVARLDESKDTTRILEDMGRHGVQTDYIVKDAEGKTPVIVQRNYLTQNGILIHKFESRNTAGRLFLDFKSLTIKEAEKIIDSITFLPKVFFFDKISPAIIKLAAEFKSRGTVIFFEPSSKGVSANQFERCIELADIVKFADQRIKDVDRFEGYSDKLIIQTQGEKGLNYRLNSAWRHLDAITNEHIVDTSGAGDWTAAALINELYKDKEKTHISNISAAEIEEALNRAQAIGAQSCSYEGARGMMQIL